MIDEIIEFIKSSRNAQEARRLIERFGFSKSRRRRYGYALAEIDGLRARSCRMSDELKSRLNTTLQFLTTEHCF